MLSTLLLNFLLFQAKVHAHPLGPNAISETDPYNSAANISSRAEPSTQASSSQLGAHVSSSSSEGWEPYVSNGDQLFKQMNARTGAQSQYTNWNDLASWGWKEVRKTGNNVDLDRFELPLKVFHDLKVDPSEKEWKHVSLTHSISVTKAGKEYNPTSAEYDTYINAKDGMILTSYIFSPDGMNEILAAEDREENIPELKHWSDVLFLVWDRYAKGHELRHIVVVDVENARTKQRVEAVTNKRTAPPLWPGVDFSLPTDKAKALLDTPVAKGITFLLSQHKQQLGVRTIKLIRPFSYIRREAVIRNLYFQIGSVSSSSRGTARSVVASTDEHQSEAFSHNLDVHNGTSFLERRVPGQATMHACATVAQAQAAAALGRRYADLMLTTDEEAEQDQMDLNTIAADQLRETGWVEEDSSRFNMNQHLQSYRALFNGLAGADDDFVTRHNAAGQPREQREVVPPISLTAASAERLRWRQNQPYMAGGRRMLPTGAVYTNLLSETNRLLVIEQAYDPKSMTEVDDDGCAQPARPDFLLPKYRSWADITMADLLERAGSRKVTPPRWFLLPGVSEPTRDMELISYCVQAYAQTTHIPAWPGVTFAYGTFCYNVMLATHMGQEIASFLIKNKHNLVLSDWALLSVTIFLAPGNFGTGGIEQPHVLWYNQRVNEGIIINRQTNINAGLDRPGARILGPTPVPVSPIRNGQIQRPANPPPALHAPPLPLPQPQPQPQVQPMPQPQPQPQVQAGPSNSQPLSNMALQAAQAATARSGARDAYQRLTAQGLLPQAAVLQIVNQYRQNHPASDPNQVWAQVCQWLDGLF